MKRRFLGRGPSRIRIPLRSNPHEGFPESRQVFSERRRRGHNDVSRGGSCLDGVTPRVFWRFADKKKIQKKFGGKAVKSPRGFFPMSIVCFSSPARQLTLQKGTSLASGALRFVFRSSVEMKTSACAATCTQTHYRHPNY